MDAKLVFFKKCVQHLRLSELLWRSVCFLYPGSWVPDVCISGLPSIPWIFRPWECLPSRYFHPEIARYFARRRTLRQLRILNCTFSLQLYENCTAACTALLGGFPWPFVFWPLLKYVHIVVGCFLHGDCLLLARSKFLNFLIREQWLSFCCFAVRR